MNDGRTRTPYPTLVDLADRLLEDCDDDVECLAVRLGSLEPQVRDELLTSDLLNAWQVFWYCFRTDPGAFLHERLELEPASALPAGLRLGEVGLLDLIFQIRDDKPWIIVADGEKIVTSFSGRDAFRNAMKYCENPEVA
jgi:hypothetical protein